jgi:alpha-ketoglutarate-dependent 2,4-dichlorophenoxyacetate dioxygenase
MITITPVRDEFAGEVFGIDCARPLTADAVDAIKDGMNRYAVLVFHEQNLTDEQQVVFTLNFGVIEPGFGKGRPHFRTDREHRVLGQSIADFSNIDAAGKPLTAESRAYMFKLADRLWHSDSSFKAIPAAWSILSGRAIPSWGGNTEFADMRAAYDALDDRTKAQIEDMVAHHSNIYSRGKIGFTDMSDAEREAHRPVRQRLVRRHPNTGRKSLFLSAHAGFIEGLSIPESRMLLMDLTEFATQERFVYSHRWRRHDLVIWDNQATMHRGRPHDPAEARDIRQTRLAGPAETISQIA